MRRGLGLFTVDRLGFALIALAVASVAPASASAEGTYWIATVGRGELVIEVPERDDAESVAWVYVLAQGAVAIPASALVRDGAIVRVEFGDIGASLELSFSDDGQVASGTWAQMGNSLDVQFRRIDVPEDVLRRKEAMEVGMHPRAPLQTLEFAFLVGEWEGTVERLQADGTYAQAGTIRWVGDWLLNGLAVQNTSQSFSPQGRVTQWGVDTRVFEWGAGRWNHRYLSAFDGSFLELHWTADEDGVLVSDLVQWQEPDGRMADHVIRIELIDDDTFRWTADASFDGGETWVENVQVNVNHRVN